MKIWIPSFLANALIRKATARPYTHLGDYMRRYWLIKPAGHGEHSDERDMKKNQWGARVHWLLQSDTDRALHDHPFDSISVILKGGYWEHDQKGGRTWRGPGSIVRRKAEDAHRLELNSELGMGGEEFHPCWSLFIMGPWRRDWGFHTAYGWVYWRDYDGGLLDERVKREKNPFINYAAHYGVDALYAEMKKAFPDFPYYKYLSCMGKYQETVLATMLEVKMDVDETIERMTVKRSSDNPLTTYKGRTWIDLHANVFHCTHPKGCQRCGWCGFDASKHGNIYK